MKQTIKKQATKGKAIKRPAFDYKAFAADLLKHRLEADLPFTALEKETGVKSTTLYRIEAARHKFDVETVAAVCQWLKKPITHYIKTAAVILLFAVSMVSCSKEKPLPDNKTLTAAHKVKSVSATLASDTVSSKGVSFYWWQYTTYSDYAGYYPRINNTNAFDVVCTVSIPALNYSTTLTVPAYSDNAVQLAYDYVHTGGAYISNMQIDLFIQSPNVRLSIVTP